MKKQRGFTLIELLVVIAIIGLLSTLAVVALNNARTKSRDARRVSDIKQMQTALELFFNDNGGYPTQEGNLGATYTVLCTDGWQATAAGCTATNNTTYMAQVPTNPTPDDNSTDSVEYSYAAADTGSVSDNSEYSITYYLAADTGGITGAQYNTACASGVSGCTAQ
jgi:general secretion pathway protein G